MIGFCDWLEKSYGRNWCVAARLTDNLRRRGYEIAFSQKRFAQLEAEYEKMSRCEAMRIAADYQRRYGVSLLCALQASA